MNNSERKQKHLTLEDRVVIESGLNAGSSMRAIALELGKDPSTISKEVRKRRTHLERNTFNDTTNQCALLKECHRKNVCDSGAITCQEEERMPASESILPGRQSKQRLPDGTC